MTMSMIIMAIIIIIILIIIVIIRAVRLWLGVSQAVAGGQPGCGWWAARLWLVDRLAVGGGGAGRGARGSHGLELAQRLL